MKRYGSVIPKAAASVERDVRTFYRTSLPWYPTAGSKGGGKHGFNILRPSLRYATLSSRACRRQHVKPRTIPGFTVFRLHLLLCFR